MRYERACAYVCVMCVFARGACACACVYYVCVVRTCAGRCSWLPGKRACEIFP